MGFLDKSGLSKLWGKISDNFSRQDHQHDYTPEGLVDVEIQESENGNYTPTGTISTPTFSGNPIDVPIVSVGAAYVDVDIIPKGSVSAPTITVNSESKEFVTDIIVNAPMIENGISLNHEYDSNKQSIEISLTNDLTILPPATTISKSNGIISVNASASTPIFTGTTSSTTISTIDVNVGFGTITPTGTISTPEFTGNAVMVSTTFNGITNQTEKATMNKIISS